MMLHTPMQTLPLNRPTSLLGIRPSVVSAVPSSRLRPLQRDLSAVFPKVKPSAASCTSGGVDADATVEKKQNLDPHLKFARSKKNIERIRSEIASFELPDRSASTHDTKQAELPITTLHLIQARISQARAGLLAYRGHMHAKKSTQLDTVQALVDQKLREINPH